MAELRALRATDMSRLDPRGFVTEASADLIVLEGARRTEFTGSFQFPAEDIFVFEPDFARLPLVTGRLDGFTQGRGGLPDVTVSQLDLDATTAFRVLFFAGDSDLFARLVFAGDDNIFGSFEADLLLGYSGADLLVGGTGDDILRGGTGGDALYGGNDADSLGGAAGRDHLFGGRGDDALHGGDGGDWLSGEDGDDRLTGGRGQDRLSGGDGADRFRFTALADSPAGSTQRDTITSFDTGEDLIDLRLIDANATARGNQPFDYIGTAPFTDTPGQLRFNPANARLLGDTDGDGTADFAINLTGLTQLPADALLL